MGNVDSCTEGGPVILQGHTKGNTFKHYWDVRRSYGVAKPHYMPYLRHTGVKRSGRVSRRTAECPAGGVVADNALGMRRPAVRFRV